MKKLFVLATAAMLIGSTVAFANDGGKNKGKEKARTEKKCTKPCPTPCPPCCDKNKCTKG